jgi:hypothetical protein
VSHVSGDTPDIFRPNPHLLRRALISTTAKLIGILNCRLEERAWEVGFLTMVAIE